MKERIALIVLDNVRPMLIYSPELSVVVFRACLDHLTKCLLIITSPTANNGAT